MIEYINTITTIEVDAKTTLLEISKVQLMKTVSEGPQGPPGAGATTFEQDLTGVSSQLQVDHNLGQLITEARIVSDTGEVSIAHVSNIDSNGNISRNSALVTSSVPMAGKLILI